ncbi:MAG: aspartate 1-decarboxylase, partial [Dehalococcoidia bacterium]
QRQMLKSKIHRATITDCNLHYAGSVTIDAELMREADLLPGELVHVLDIDNGARFETYTIEGQAGSREVCINGAAARLVQAGDKVIIVSYGLYDEQELRHQRPRVVHVDELNSIVHVDADPSRVALEA